MPNDITHIEAVESFSDSVSPARVNRRTGKLYLNKSRWNDIPKEHRVFIILHERAHVVLNSSDEKKVDALAFEWYRQLGYPLTESVFALSRVLNAENPNHIERTALQLQRAKLIDIHVNKNPNAHKILTENKSPKMCECQKPYNQTIHTVNHGFIGTITDTDDYTDEEFSDYSQVETYDDIVNNPYYVIRSIIDNFNGTSDVYFDDYEGCQPGEKPRQCRKRIKVESKAAKRENKSEAKRLKGEYKANLGEQGIVDTSRMDKFQGVMKGIGSAVSGIMGGGGDAGSVDAYGNFIPQPKSDNKMLYIGFGIGGFILIMMFFFMMMRKQN